MFLFWRSVFDSRPLWVNKSNVVALERREINFDDKCLKQTRVLNLFEQVPTFSNVFKSVLTCCNLPSVWPDVEAKSWSKYSKAVFFKIAQKVTLHLGYFCKKICQQELSKILNLVTLFAPILTFLNKYDLFQLFIFLDKFEQLSTCFDMSIAQSV